MTIILCVDFSTVHGFVNAFSDLEEIGFLDTHFRLNVKGTTSISGIRLIGTITAEPGTASKLHCSRFIVSCIYCKLHLL